MLYDKLVFVTDVKYIPSWIITDLMRMYKYVCFEHIITVRDVKKSLDKAYASNEGYIHPAPVYVYTLAEVNIEAKAKISRYCNGLGVTDVCFKVHV